MRIVLVTGASRGIGAVVAHRLAEPDTHVILNYRENATRANAIADNIRAAGGHASTMAADLSDHAAVAAMVDTIAAVHGRIDALILNASGGFELGADPGYALRLNRDAQRRLALLALPLMPSGGHIVFVTSHQAHFFPHKAVPKGYAAVAASKRAGETALYTMRSEFDAAGVHLTVASADVVDGTIGITLPQPEAITPRRSQAPQPTVTDFAAAIVKAANDPHPPGIVYVGGSDYLMTVA